ncbi:MAG: MBL fold metallo-hydrolase [Spirochaetes bacterium]|nr:MBL fold metallo-hydrolase [Spirochaetota bacterium]
MKIQFLGGTGTVTGSKYLVTVGETRILVDCGLYQGLKELRLRNWDALPVDPKSIAAVVLTHAHIDHSGYLPLLVKKGFKGKIYCTPATQAQCGILLPDSGWLQEEEARFANKHGFSKHHPALPLYTQDDALIALEKFTAKEYGVDFPLPAGVTCRFENAGHILGSALVRLKAAGQTLTFTGDIGRPNDPLLFPPEPLAATDYLVVESTYGDRVHDSEPPEERLAEIITEAAQNKSVVLVPAFSVGRTQLLLYYLAKLRRANRIPEMPVFLNSPMSISATEIFRNFPSAHRLDAETCQQLRDAATYIRTPEESRRLNETAGPMVIISANGMASGGRILHHLKAFAPHENNVILLTGFQAVGTRGAALQQGAKTLRIHGEEVPVRARVEMLHSLSAHADGNEIIAWLKRSEKPPLKTFVTHGEPESARALAEKIQVDLNWNAAVPEYLQEVEL